MLQLNSKELKSFRNTLALWHVADFKLADEICQKNNRVKAIQTLIESNNQMIEKIVNKESGVMKSLEELTIENKTYESKIEAENEALAKLKEEFDKDIAKGRALVSEDLIKAIKEYLSNIYDDSKEVELLTTLAKWFENQGAKVDKVDDVKPYIRALGQKKNGAKAKVKTVSHNGLQSDKALVDIFLGAICDEPNMKKVLPVHKFVTIIEKKTSNK